MNKEITIDLNRYEELIKTEKDFNDLEASILGMQETFKNKSDDELLKYKEDKIKNNYERITKITIDYNTGKKEIVYNKGIIE